eukprot:TRINITY_DN3092_c0_g1_i1.p1 TRINITY_DN3092_c0_g1~~TRINITY_DN3092_c0_g1_i1.p1  ORF type:complete len:344 (-),score=82.86 TRINITY_DN3092_c0_g1_i1:49-1080(-)
MRPIVLKGHERPITQIVFNREGDLLFSASKDKRPNVWRVETGERLGTYNGHNGAVYSIDVDASTKNLISGSGDSCVKLWDVKSGKEKYSWENRAPIRFVEFAEGDRMFLTASAAVMGMTANILIYKLADDVQDQANEAALTINTTGKILQAHWTPLNREIITCNEDGTVRVYDAETGDEIDCVEAHSSTVNSISFTRDRSCFVTASKDHYAKLYDTRSREHLKTYDSGRPVNTACISPLMDHILLGGGQSAESVTTTRLDSSQFKVRFFHKIFEDEIGAIPGHFGPVNTVMFHPNGRSYASGGEDGFIRLHHLDDSYFKGMSNEALFGRGMPQATPPVSTFGR